MGFMGAAKGQLENNSSVTAYRVRCASVDCAAEQRFVPQSMTLVQKALEDAGWVYTPGVDVGEGPTMGCWRCGPCGKLTMEEGTPAVALEGEGNGDDGEGEEEEEKD